MSPTTKIFPPRQFQFSNPQRFDSTWREKDRGPKSLPRLRISPRIRAATTGNDNETSPPGHQRRLPRDRGGTHSAVSQGDPCGDPHGDSLVAATTIASLVVWQAFH